MEYRERIRVDLSEPNRMYKFRAKQADNKSRWVDVTITANRHSYDVPEGVTAYVRYLKPDGYTVINPCVINEDGTVSFNLTDQMLCSTGVAQFDLVLNQSDHVLSTITLYCQIEKVPIGASAVTSSDEYGELTEQIALAIDAVDRANRQEDRVDDLVTDARTLIADIENKLNTGALSAQIVSVHAENGESASVVNTGTESRVELSFTLPKGVDGKYVETVWITLDGHLMCRLSDGVEIDAGPVGNSGEASDHTFLMNRDADNQHPISAIAQLQDALDAKQDLIPANTYDAYGAADAVGADLSEHAEDTGIHVTAEEKAAWDAKQDAIPANTYDTYGSAAAVAGDLSDHESDAVSHITASERTTWNDKCDLTYTITSTW